jgi:hypothetical protein
MSALVRYIVSKSCGQPHAIIRKELRVARPARDGDVGHAVVKQVFRSQLRVDMNQDALGGLHLAGMAGDRITMIEMRMVSP